MTRGRPKGAKFRNLTARGGVIYYERVVRGRRIRISTKTNDWSLAASFRDLYEQHKQIGKIPFAALEAPTFGEAAARYVSEDTRHLAWTTVEERKRMLRREGDLLGFFGATRIDDITEAMIRDWWGVYIEGNGRSIKTGRNYLDALSAVFAYARELGILRENPVVSFRELVARRTRTQRGRAQTDPARNIRPVEDPAEIDRLIRAAEAEGEPAYLIALLLLDAGLRLGEALGLRFGHVVWGEGEDDPRRSLRIQESRPRGGRPGPTKSGRSRSVALSRRLRRALLEVYRSRFAPPPEAHVLIGIEPHNFRKREWRRICERAKLGHRRLKDLRDTFASHLLTSGVQLGYVSRQLGHTDVAVTARHYARWIDSVEYHEPLRVRPGEVPADLLARLANSPQSPPRLRIISDGIAASTRKDGAPGTTRTCDPQVRSRIKATPIHLKLQDLRDLRPWRPVPNGAFRAEVTPE